MAAQTTISNDPAFAYEGMLSEVSGFAVDVISKVSNETNGISAGRMVRQGTADNQCNLPAAATDITGSPLLGVALFDPSMPTNWPPSSVSNAYPNGEMVSIVRKGRVWVFVEQAVTTASPVFCRYAAGSFSVLGRFRVDADTASAAAVPTARFMTSAGIGGLALLEINLV